MYNYFRWFPEGEIVFAAPSRPLVMQQIEACHNIVGIPQEWTIEMTGVTSPSKRASLWKSKRVFFLTPQVLEKDIQSEHCGVSLHSSSMKQKAEKFETSISINSPHECCTTKSEDFIGSHKSNDKVPENVEARASESVCPNSATYMIPENCKFFGGDGKQFSCSETYPGNEMMGCETLIANMVVLSEQENELEESPCINERYRSEDAIKTNVAAIVDKLVDQLIEREEVTGSREKCESVSGESECPTSEVSAKKCVVDGEAAQHPVFLDGSTCFADLEVAKGNCDRDQTDAKCSVYHALQSQSFGGNGKVTDETEGLTPEPFDDRWKEVGS